LNQSLAQSSSSPDDERLSQIVQDVIRRRDGGEHVSDEELLEAHPDLAPRLRASLVALRRVEEAQHEAQSASADLEATLPHEAFPDYDLVNEVHRGGQGVVYRARQRTTGREVAVKVMRDGSLHGPHAMARFEREVRILGRLRHPNIVTIHDSGTAGGNCYFVMDYISGQPLDQFTVTQGMSVRASLELFAKICDAVDAAHLHGVIHRDLKPGNIRIDDRGEPLILDFGLAKITNEDIPDAAAWHSMTAAGQFVGSLPWSSPEQAEGPAAVIDLRTDVYSLGVILFHMLTGCFPYDVTGNIRDVLRNIAEKPAVAPSTIRRDVDADVDVIVLKCLQKEPQRRYQSVGAIAEDVRRFLNDQPILARAPSALYQLKKLAYRHKVPSVLLAVLAASLVTLTVLLAYHRSQDLKLIKRMQEAERLASIEADATQAVNSFLVNDLLAAARPEIAHGDNLTVREVLDNAAKRIDGAFGQQPLIEASIRAAIGQSYASLGLYPDAEPFLRKTLELRGAALGDEHPDTLAAECGLANLLYREARYSEAATLAQHNLDIARRVFGERHERTLQALDLQASLHLYIGRLDEARRLFRYLLDVRKETLGASDPKTLGTLTNWAYASLVRSRKHVEAEQVFRDVLRQSREKLGEEHPLTVRARVNLAEATCAERKLDEAETLFQQALRAERRIFGDDHPDTIVLKLFFSRLRQAQGRLSDALELLRQSTASSRRVLGDRHPATLQSMEALGHILGLKGEFAQSLAIHREALRLNRELYGEDHFATAQSLYCLGMALAWTGRHAEAEACLRKSVATFQSRSHDSPPPVGPLRALVMELGALDRGEEARPFAEELLAHLREGAEAEDTDAYHLNCYARALLTVEPPDLRDPPRALKYALKAYDMCTDAYYYNRYMLALAHEANGDIDSAIAMAQRAVAVVPEEVSDEKSLCDALLVRLLERTGDNNAAEKVYRDTLAARRAADPVLPLEVAESLARLGETLVRHGAYTEAEPPLRECLETRTGLLPENHWRIGEAMSLLGAALAGQGRLDDARPLLVDGNRILADSPMGESDVAAATRHRLEAWSSGLESAGKATHDTSSRPTP